MSDLLRGFPPVLGERPRVLILGSMPSVRSLARAQYYGHPQNAFWPIMGALCGFDPALPYDARCAALSRAGIALWDVLGACRREGSLDSAIERDSEQPNAIAELLAQEKTIGLVLFNGAKAEQAFQRHIAPVLRDDVRARIQCQRMPSTSPANARMTRQTKLAAWREVLSGTLP